MTNLEDSRWTPRFVKRLILNRKIKRLIKAREEVRQIIDGMAEARAQMLDLLRDVDGQGGAR